MKDFLTSRLLWFPVIMALLTWGVFSLADKFVAPQHLFWKPLSINAPLGMATQSQLLKLSLSPRDQCLSLMQSEAQNSVFTIDDPRRNDKGCGWEVALTTTQSRDISFKPDQMQALCPMQAASYIWLTYVDESAQALLGSGLKRVHHYGTYSCRKVSGTSRWSEHAFANAWDVSAFELDDGRIISVLKDWDAPDERAGFLRAAHGWGCDIFRVTLGPDYNDAHKDHFHIDMGPGRLCR